MFFLLIASDCFLVDGFPSTELQQMNAIVKKLEAKIDRQEANMERQEGKIEKQEAKIEKQEAVINELHGKNEALGRELRSQKSELAERIETECNRTEETIMAISDREFLSGSGDSAVRDLPYIMMCAYQDHWTSTGIIAYDELTLDFSNCDRPGETFFKAMFYLPPRWRLFCDGHCQWNFYS